MYNASLSIVSSRFYIAVLGFKTYDEKIIFVYFIITYFIEIIRYFFIFLNTKKRQNHP
jgi:hypothetical protein